MPLATAAPGDPLTCVHATSLVLLMLNAFKNACSPDMHAKFGVRFVVRFPQHR